MSTRCNIQINKGDTHMLLYHHHDGYPDGVGKELENFLKQTANKEMTPHSVCKGLKYLYGDNYEDTSSVHGDIDYFYIIDILDNQVNLSCKKCETDWTQSSMYHYDIIYTPVYDVSFPFNRNGEKANKKITKGDLKKMRVMFRSDMVVNIDKSRFYKEYPDELEIDEKQLKKLLMDAYSDEILKNIKIEIM